MRHHDEIRPVERIGPCVGVLPRGAQLDWQSGGPGQGEGGDHGDGDGDSPRPRDPR